MLDIDAVTRDRAAHRHVLAVVVLDHLGVVEPEVTAAVRAVAGQVQIDGAGAHVVGVVGDERDRVELAVARRCCGQGRRERDLADAVAELDREVADALCVGGARAGEHLHDQLGAAGAR